MSAARNARKLPRLLSVRAFADETSIPLSTVYLLVNRGELRAIRYGAGRGSVRIREDDALAWIEEHTTDGGDGLG